MKFTREQQKEAYKRLPLEVQDFVMSNETTELIDSFLKKVDLSEDQNISADSEILYAMYGLQTFEIAMGNIAKLSGKNRNELSELEENLKKNIFNEIDQINSKSFQSKTEQEKPQKLQTQDGVGQSFEQIILNQAKAMQPARPVDETGGVTSNEVRDTKETEEQRAIHNYVGSDPYREPIE